MKDKPLTKNWWITIAIIATLAIIIAFSIGETINILKQF